MAGPGALILNQHNYATEIPSIAKGFMGNPLDEARAEALGVNVAKQRSDMQAALAERQAKAEVAAAIAAGLRGKELAALMAKVNADYVGKIGSTNLFLGTQAPDATPGSITRDMLSAGHGYSTTPEGTVYVQGQENKRASIAAGPGYARVAEERRQFETKPVVITDPDGSNPRVVLQGQMRGMTGVQPFEPNVATKRMDATQFSDNGTNYVGPYSSVFTPSTPFRQAPIPAEVQTKTVETGDGPGGSNQLRLFSTAFQDKNAVYNAPTPAGVQTKQVETKPAVPLGQPNAQPEFKTEKDLAAGGYGPPPATKAEPAPPAPERVTQKDSDDIEQLILTAMARRAGQADDYFGTPWAPKNQGLLPELYRTNRDQILLEAFARFQANKNQPEAAAFALNKGMGGEDWKLQVPSTLGWILGGGSTQTPGSGYTGPQQPNREPTGQRVIVPQNRTPAPTTARPQATQQQSTQTAAPPRPQMSDADILTHAQATIQANPAARADVISRLRAWNIDTGGL